MYVDFSKAFDTVCHSKLVRKLSAYGITGNLLSWITDFLARRTQATKIDTNLSNELSIVSGVVPVGQLPRTVVVPTLY